jgi:hypothetical protein
MNRKQARKKALRDAATPVEGFAADNALKARNLAKWAPNLGYASDVSNASTRLPSDGLPTDPNLQRAVDQSQTAYQRANREPPIANAPQETAADSVAKLDSAIGQLAKAIAKVGAGRDAGMYSKLERLRKAKLACETAKAQILSKTGHDSAGTDSTMRMVASKEDAAPGYSTAVAGIARLQARQNRSPR